MNFITKADKDIKRKIYYRSISFMNMVIKILNKTLANQIKHI